MIYFDNAATTMIKPPQVAEAMVKALGSLGNAGRGVNEASLEASMVIYDARCALAGLFHIEDPSRIAFTCNVTESLNIAIKGLLDAGDHVVTTVLEHNSVLRPLYEMEKKGVKVTYLPCDGRGMVYPEAFAAAVRDDTRAFICTHGSNVTGNLLDIEKIGRIAAEKGIIFITDVSQTAGVFDIDTERMNIDILCFTGHKSLCGPQGTGGIYVRKGLSLRPLKSGGSGVHTYDREHPAVMPTALEAGTLNGPGIAGLGAAVSLLDAESMKKKRERVSELTGYFYGNLKKIPGISIYGDFSARERCPVVSFNLKGYDSSELGDILFNEYDIAVRTGAHCAPLMHQALGTVQTGAVRFSFSEHNREDEIDAAIKALNELV